MSGFIMSRFLLSFAVISLFSSLVLAVNVTNVVINVQVVENTTLRNASCKADSTFPPVDYMWIKKESPDSAPTNHSFEKVTEFNETGIYQCLARNKDNAADTWIRSPLYYYQIVPPKPVVTIFYDEQETGKTKRIKFEEGKRTQLLDKHAFLKQYLYCYTENIYLIPQIEWSTSSYSNMVTVDINPMKQPYPEGTYTCMVKYTDVDYSAHIQTVTVTLGFKYKTSLVRTFKGPYSDSQETTLSCDANGIPEPVYQWRRKTLEGFEFLNYDKKQNITVKEPGFYQCYAQNPMNRPDEWVNSLEVIVVNSNSKLFATPCFILIGIIFSWGVHQ